MFLGEATTIGQPSQPSLIYHLLRQPNCSLTAQSALKTSPYTVTALQANYQDVLHKQAQLTTTPDKFPIGCGAIAEAGSYGPGAALPSGGHFVVIPANGKPNLTVYSFNAAMTFTGSTTITLSSFPGFPVLADVNKDGIEDIVVTVEGSTEPRVQPKIAVLLGNKDGTFQSPVYYPVIPIGSVSVADLNGDGNLDLYVVGQSYAGGATDPTLQVLPGKGDGTFGTPINGPTGLTNTTVEAVSGLFDTNSSSHVDLVTNDGHVLIGDGTGNFTLQSGTQFPFSSWVVAGDFNGDGKGDVAVGNETNQTIQIYRGNGDGTFTPGPIYATINVSYGFSASDLDGDGNLDLAIGSGSIGGFGPDLNSFPFSQFLLGRGDGTFAGAQFLPSTATLLDPFVVDTFEGGSKEDILTTGSVQSGPVLALWSNNGSGSFTAGATSPIKAAATLLVSGDLNSDGKRDAVMAASTGATSGEVDVALGNGNGTFQTPVSTTVALSPTAIALGNIFGASSQDLVVAGAVASNTAGLILLPNKADGTFKSPIAIATLSANSNVVGMAVADLNKDGKPDIVLANSGNSGASAAGSVLVYLGNGGGAFQPPTAIATNTYPLAVAVGDVNGDGKPDLVVAAEDANFNGSVYVALGNGDGTFKAATQVATGLNGPSSILIADLNGDKKPDITVSTSDTAEVMLGNGDGTFGALNSLPIPSAPSYVTGADLNGDGKIDLIALADGGIVPLLNITGSAPPPVTASASEWLKRFHHTASVVELAALELGRDIGLL